MSEVESKRSQDARRATAMRQPETRRSTNAQASDQAPNQESKSGNDGQVGWKLVPFPEGWYAGC